MPLRSEAAHNAYQIAYRWLRYSYAPGRDSSRLVHSFKSDFVNIFSKRQLYLWDAAALSFRRRRVPARGWVNDRRQDRWDEHPRRPEIAARGR